MKQIFTSLRMLGAIALLALAAGCASTQSTENMLVAAGFKVITPKTAAQQQRLKALPPDKVTAVQRSGKTYYVFPDAPSESESAPPADLHSQGERTRARSLSGSSRVATVCHPGRPVTRLRTT